MHKSGPRSEVFVCLEFLFCCCFLFYLTRNHLQVPNCINFGEESASLQQGMEKQQAFEMFDCKAQIAFYWDLFQNVNMLS